MMEAVWSHPTDPGRAAQFGAVWKRAACPRVAPPEPRLSLLACLQLWLLALIILPASAAPAFNADRAYQDLVAQCNFGPRVPGTSAHDQCADWLVAQFRACTNSVSRQTFTQTVGGQELHLTNIIATLNPKGARPVLLSAHWDTRPRAEEDPNPARRSQPILGADDGASGVAVLLELARELRALRITQKVTFVLFDGEDWGTTTDTMFLGSRYFADHWQGTTPVWAALLDMVGDKDLQLPVEAFSEQRAPAVVARVWNAARHSAAPAFVGTIGPAILDDHLLLLDKGIPCIDIIDFTYPYWHTAADTPDKCSPASLGQVGRTLLTAVMQGEVSRTGKPRRR